MAIPKSNDYGPEIVPRAASAPRPRYLEDLTYHELERIYELVTVLVDQSRHASPIGPTGQALPILEPLAATVYRELCRRPHPVRTWHDVDVADEPELIKRAMDGDR